MAPPPSLYARVSIYVACKGGYLCGHARVGIYVAMLDICVAIPFEDVGFTVELLCHLC